MSRYESRHGRQPFPWLLILGYPFLWLYGALSECRRPTQEPVTGPLVRLWDKDFNLLATFDQGQGPITATVDQNGTRFAASLEVRVA